ncbi:Lacal_2735 family protein [Algoriphagus sp. A40]|uniref:Lacal_2735 family protein n=1 Tax=Algoriphagus sp. A40 TaxID=1945863 RepID=UPI00111561FC|nr:Lacal_2735 family protein [Algoriphagus sp. A40]
MFGLFKKKSEKEKLQEAYEKILSQAFKISHSNRTASDRMLAEAEEIAKKIEEL